MSKKKSKDRRGRKPLSAFGLERRQCRVIASFTPTQHARLVDAADDEGISLAELVAQRALAITG